MIELEAVTYTYPFQTRPAVSKLDLRIEPGEAFLVTGASGCGKSTLIRLINGLIPWYFRGTLEGAVWVRGEATSARCIHAISHDVGTLFQDPEQQFFALTVEDEIAFAHEWRNAPPKAIARYVDTSLQQLAIRHLAGANIHHLSEGEKQKVALAGIRSLSPQVLILDEPTANLDPESTATLAAHLQALKATGMTLLIVDHRLYWLHEWIDWAVVMMDGAIAEVTKPERLTEEAVRYGYGLRRSQVNDVRQTLPPATGRNRWISVDGLSFAYGKGSSLFDRLDLELPCGEVVGLIGDNGVGKTTFARLLTGLLKAEHGVIRINGEVINGRRLLRRTSLVLQNTDHQLHMKTVRGELEAAAAGAEAGGGKVLIDAVLDDYQLTPLAARHPQSLSGGEKQRLVIACGHVRRPDLFILDEPSSGLDGKNLETICNNLRALARSGCCVLVISHDLELLEQVCTCKIELTRAGSEQR